MQLGLGTVIGMLKDYHEQDRLEKIFLLVAWRKKSQVNGSYSTRAEDKDIWSMAGPFDLEWREEYAERSDLHLDLLEKSLEDLSSKSRHSPQLFLLRNRKPEHAEDKDIWSVSQPRHLEDCLVRLSSPMLPTGGEDEEYLGSSTCSHRSESTVSAPIDCETSPSS